MISPIAISPFAIRIRPQVSSILNPIIADYLWYMPNTLNQSGNIITVQDTGTVGGMNLQNPALANKPTASTIDGKLSYIADGIDDYLYKSTLNFGKTYTNWMAHFVVKATATPTTRLLTCLNETNPLLEGVLFQINSSNQLQVVSTNSAGVVDSKFIASGMTAGNNFVLTFSYDGTKIRIHRDSTLLYATAATNPFSRPTQTDNLTMFALIRTTNTYNGGNIGFASFEPYNAIKLTDNINTLKTLYAIT